MAAVQCTVRTLTPTRHDLHVSKYGLQGLKDEVASRCGYDGRTLRIVLQGKTVCGASADCSDDQEHLQGLAKEGAVFVAVGTPVVAPASHAAGQQPTLGGHAPHPSARQQQQQHAVPAASASACRSSPLVTPVFPASPGVSSDSYTDETDEPAYPRADVPDAPAVRCGAEGAAGGAVVPPPPPPPPATPESIRDTLALSFPQELLDRFIEDNGDECLTALPLSELVSILNEEVESERQRLQQREQEAHADPSAAMYDSEDSSEYSDDADVSVPAHTASSTLAHLGRDDQTKVESLMSIITGLSEEDALSVYMRHNKNVHAAAAELLDM